MIRHTTLTGLMFLSSLGFAVSNSSANITWKVCCADK